MWKALISFLLLFSQPFCILADGTYECGDHGRFEYCIDEIPGCVIGCHCHPGYYFDTDTKICEPNSRLIKQHRRDNIVQPAQDQKNFVRPNVIYDTEPAFNDKKIDNQVDEIAKDANDLGDWLYNQFFKTIENQVINNTNDKDVLTRRSGSKQRIKTPKRSKKWSKRGKSSKQNVKKKHLRRKLLRITENDSLFDISSKSSSDSSDSSSSSDLSSMEYEVDSNNQHKHEDDQHGHKKIVMINKKPKQPLPSFIFLPNLDTPFYPPIGLPPPPIVPMHPMIPVPPVPMYVISVSQDNTTAAAAASNTTSTITTLSSLSETTPVNAFSTDVTTATDVPKTDIKSLRLKNKKKRKKATRLLNNDGIDTEQGISNLKYTDRQKILQHLREKLSNPSVNLSMPSWKKNKKVFANKFADQNTDVEIPFTDVDNRIIDDEYSNNGMNPKKLREDGTFSDNVDFKYITELIHHVDLNNKSNDLPPIEYNPLDSIEMYQSPNIHKKHSSVPFDTLDGRRTYRPMYHKPDESFYANLGRQIAKMIRGKDTQNDLKEMSSKINNDPYLSNPPTSFWERSVRSPYLETKNKNYDFLKKSNELLFDIENKVEIIASTTPALSLQEIENIVKVMEAAKREIQRKNKPNVRNSRTSRKNLNIELWPQKSQNLKNSYKNSVLSHLNQINQENNISNYRTNNNKIIKPDDSFADVRMHSIKEFLGWNNENLEQKNRVHNISTSAKPLNINNYLNTAPANYNSGRPNIIQQILAETSPLSQNTIKQTFLNQQINPYSMPRRKYFQDNYSNYYVNQNEELPRRPPVVRYNWSSRHIFLK